MKLLVEIELDWLGEDGKVDDIVKDEIVGRIASSLDKEFVKSMKEDAAKTVSRQVQTRVNELLDDFLGGQPIIITDSYGDKKHQYENVRELLKERFDKFMVQPVDQNGKPYTGCGYGDKKYTNLTFLLDSMIKERFEKSSKEIMASTEVKIKQAIDQTVKTQINDFLIKKMDVLSAIAPAKDAANV